MASAPQHELWKWKPVYESAVLECDLTKLPQRIVVAQRAITERLRSFDPSMSEAERIALFYARIVLCDLCKMAGLPTIDAWNVAG